MSFRFASTVFGSVLLDGNAVPGRDARAQKRPAAIEMHGY
jgi:hypothetical protein